MKLLRIYLTTVVVVSLAVGVQAARLALDTVTSSPDDNATLSLTFMAENDTVSTFQADVMFPTPLSYLSVADGPAAGASGKDVSASQINGGARILVFGLNQNALVDGVMATITLHVDASAPDGTYPVSIINVTASDPDAQGVPVATGNGAVTVGGGSGTARLAIGSGSGTCDEMVTLPLTLTTNGTDVATFQVDVMFGTPLTYSSLSAGPVADAAGKEVTGTAISGGARVIVVGLNQNTMGDGVVANLTLGIAANATEGSYPVNLVSPSLADPDAQSVDVTTLNGVVTVDDCDASGCTGPYFYWTEIAAHGAGQAGSVWRTDVTARNASSFLTNVEITLHTETGDHTYPAAIPPSAQAVFEDIVALMGVVDKGALEVCSDMPLRVNSRIYNQGPAGTFGQFMDGYMSSDGLAQGQTAELLGLRQREGEFRTNISVTNTGTAPAVVEVTLYATDATPLHTYSINVGAGIVVQDLEPFSIRAGRPDLGWGYATVRVVNGSGILSSASVIDSRTNDPTTIPMKR